MERRYYRQYENYDTIVPKLSDFPLINGGQEKKEEIIPHQAISRKETNKLFGMTVDDIIIIAVIVLLMMEEEKNFSAIVVLGILFLSGFLD